MIASRARLRRSSSLHGDEATPTTGTSLGREVSRTMWYTAGKSFFLARSPVMPNRTSASPCGFPSSAVATTSFGLPDCRGCLLGNLDDLVEDPVVVRQAGEQHLVGTRCDRDAAIDQRVEPTRVRRLIGSSCSCVVGRKRRTEEQAD